MKVSSSNNGLDFSSVAAAAATYQIKLFEIAQANMQLAFEYAQALTAVRSSGEFVSVTSEYAKKRMDIFNKHTKELAEFLPTGNAVGDALSAANRWEVVQKGSQENAFVTLGFVGSRFLYEIAVYEFKIGREKPLIIAVRSHRGLFSAFSGICQ